METIYDLDTIVKLLDLNYNRAKFFRKCSKVQLIAIVEQGEILVWGYLWEGHYFEQLWTELDFVHNDFENSENPNKIVTIDELTYFLKYNKLGVHEYKRMSVNTELKAEEVFHMPMMHEFKYVTFNSKGEIILNNFKPNGEIYFDLRSYDDTYSYSNIDYLTYGIRKYYKDKLVPVNKKVFLSDMLERGYVENIEDYHDNYKKILNLLSKVRKEYVLLNNKIYKIKEG